VSYKHLLLLKIILVFDLYSAFCMLAISQVP
jgi:hypothetical protein